MQGKDYKTSNLLRCCMCIGGAMGMVSNCIGIYFSSLAEALNVGVGRISVMVTIMSLASAFSAPLFVRLHKRFRLPHVMGAGVVLCIISYVLMSFAKDVTTLYVCGALSGVGMCFFAALPVTIVLREWYGERNGTALGTALAFSGVFGAVMNPVLSRLISAWSYRASLRIMAVFLAAVVLPCALTMKMKEKTDAGSPETAQKTTADVPLSTFAVLVSTCVLFCALCGMNQHLSAMGVSMGFSLEASATILTCAMVGNIIFKLVYGAACDRVNPIYVSILWAVIGIAGTAMMFISAGNGLLVRAGAFLYGTFFSLSTVALSQLTQRVAGDGYAEVYSRLVIFTTSSYALSVSLFGAIYDLSGSYLPALAAVIAFAALSIVLSLRLNKKIIQPAA